MSDDENNKVSYDEIPLDNEIIPTVLLYDEHDSIEITPI